MQPEKFAIQTQVYCFFADIELQFLQEASKPNPFYKGDLIMFNMEKFARLLSGRRREKGLTQDQLADLVGVTHQAVSKWERAEALPEMSKIGDIAKAVDTPTEELISSLYGGETEKVNNAEEPNGNADAEYFALEDKTRVGDIYAIAPRLSKETMRLAIDNLISAKGASAAAMLYRFADSEYLSALGKQLLARGNICLAAYVDEPTLKGAVIDTIATADMQSDWRRRDEFYSKAGALLVHCKDIDFINEMFVHLTGHVGTWNPWQNSIASFPSEVVVKQGTRYMIWRGPSSFNAWWHIIGRRNAAKMFIGYAAHFDNNAQAWRDISIYYSHADTAILESAIKERLENPAIDPKVFKPLYNFVNPDLKAIIKEKAGIEEPARENSNTVVLGRNFNSSFERMFNDRFNDKLRELLEEELSCAGDLEELPEIMEKARAIGLKLQPQGSNGDDLSAILAKLEEISERFDEIESRLDDLESSIDELE